MSVRIEGWTRCEEPGWALTFSYPTNDAAGDKAVVERRRRGSSMESIHVMARDRDEIYFEVVRDTGTSASDWYASMQERLPEMYPDVQFAPLVDGVGSSRGSFSWADQERSVQFFERTDATYRVILRPVGPVNLDIRATIETLSTNSG